MLGALIGAGTSLLGGLLGKSSQEKAAKKEYKRQKEFAQHGISWKVEDAKRAGIAPLAALGSNLVSYSPQSIGGGDYGVSQAGQDIGRAIDATRSPPERLDAVARTAQALELERGQLQNDLLRAQIAKLNQAGHPPGIAVDDNGFLIPGQPNSGLAGVEVQPSKTSVVSPHVPYEQRGSVPDVHYADTTGGGYYPVPGAVVKQQIEDMAIPELMWSIRNNILPMFSSAYQKPPAEKELAWDEEWYFHPIDGYKKRKIRTQYSSPPYRIQKWKVY